MNPKLDGARVRALALEHGIVADEKTVAFAFSVIAEFWDRQQAQSVRSSRPNSRVAAFVREACVVGPEHMVPRESLYRQWSLWCLTNGVLNFGTKIAFGADLRALLPEITDRRPRIGHKAIRHYVGIKSLTAQPPT